MLARIKAAGVPHALKKQVTALGKVQRELEVASRAADDAKAARDAALDAVGAADTVLDAALDVLADKLVGARLAPRNRAFKGFSGYAPSALKDLGYADEVREVGKLVTAVKRQKPPAPVAKAAAACAAAAKSSSAALRALSRPQADYARLLVARDALLPAWKRAYERLRIYAKAVWLDNKALYQSVFAAPDAVAGTTHRPARRTITKGAAKGANGAAARTKATPKPSPKPVAARPTNGAAAKVKAKATPKAAAKPAAARSTNGAG